MSALKAEGKDTGMWMLKTVSGTQVGITHAFHHHDLNTGPKRTSVKLAACKLSAWRSR